MNLQKLQKILFYFIIFLIPCNLAKHWPQDWSYVHGILVDYLIPTVYLTDILIFLLLFLWIYESLISKLKTKSSKLQLKTKNYKIFYLLSVVLLFTVYSLLFTKNPRSAIYKLIKLIEFGLFILWIRHKGVSLKEYPLRSIPCLSVIWQSVLAIAQWFKQGSIFGYWFFGEQLYTSATLGIKKISLFGQIKVLPMGTFPHPNVLAGFLVVSLILILSLLTRDRVLSRIKLFKIGSYFLEATAFLLGIIALGLTFSLPAWTALLVIGGYLLAHAEFLQAGWLVVRKKKRKNIVFSQRLIILWMILLLGAGSLKSLRGLRNLRGLINAESISRRIELNKIAIKMWQSSPVFGVGLNNFIPRMEEFGRVITNYRFLQPVHNVFLLVLSETGIVGIVIITYGLIKIVKSVISVKPVEPVTESLKLLSLLTLLALLFLGLFDHYFLTIQQGMLVVSMILGLSLGY